MSASVVFSPAAEADLDDIWLNIALENPAAADRLIDDIRQRSDQLSEFPELGPLRPDIIEAARSLNAGNYLILYRIVTRTVEVVRSVHGARDLTPLF
jgi:toxin ParE1/3/4